MWCCVVLFTERSDDYLSYCILYFVFISLVFNQDGRKAISEVHKAYLDAGADIITAASYQASYEGFQKAGVDDATAEACMQESVQIARKVKILSRLCGAALLLNHHQLHFNVLRPFTYLVKTRDAFLATSLSSFKPIVAVSIGSYGAAMADGRYVCL